MRAKGGHRNGGVTMVEFALVLPLLLAIVLGVIEAHLYWSAAAMADHAASIGVLAAAGASPEHPDQPDVDGAYRIAAGLIQTVDLKAARLAPIAGGTATARKVCPSPSDGCCPPPDDRWPIGVIYVCLLPLPQDTAVSVTVEGWIPAYVPPTFGLKVGWRTGALLIHTPPHYLHATYFTA